MAVTLKTYNEIVGSLARKIIANSPLNDINTGSVLLQLLEAVAANDYENNTAILTVLELLNIDATRNNDLDARAADFGLTRKAAVKASGFITISDSNISKRSTGLYPVKQPPIAGATVINVNNAAAWSNTGQLYIGRGTPSFEGPIPYTSIVNNTTFYTINLGSALQKDHLISDIVIDGQGTNDRLIAAGTIVKIPANNQNPEIEYVTLRDAVIPAGEDSVVNVEVVARIAGASGNAGINGISTFGSLPFTGATVTNTTAFTNGRDVETDDELRNRIKSFAQTLARGTKPAILNAIDGVSDPDDNKQVASAVITEPVKIGDPSIIYLDDGNGLQPSYTGQSVDELLADANGDEELLQLANFPIPRPQVVNAAEGPYELQDGMYLRVTVDDEEETVFFFASQFTNISAATLPEIVTVINDNSTIFKARLDKNSTRLLVYPTAFDAEIIQVSPIRTSESADLFANSVLKFPTNEYSYIKLYQNNVLLKEKQKSATLLTNPFNTWNVNATSNIIISVDGTPSQDREFSTTDFGGASFASLTLEDWVAVFNTKFAGLQAEALSSGVMRITSNKSGAESQIDVLGGSLLTKWFADLPTEAQGQTSDFALNRQNGNIRILRDIAPGDDFTAGSEDTKGAIYSKETTTGTYNVSSDSNSRPSELVIVADAKSVVPRVISLPIGATIDIQDMGSGVMRITSSSLSTFKQVFATGNDYVYITNRGDIDGTGGGTWADIASCGLFKVITKGEHTTAGSDSYIEVTNANIVPGTYTVQSSDDIQAFYSDAYPQIWKGTFVDNPPLEPIQGIVDSINENISNVIASIWKTNSIKLTSITENEGSIAVPVSVGNATLLFDSNQGQQVGNTSHVANREADKDAVTYFKRTTPSTANVWLDRSTYTDLKGTLSNDAIPGIKNVDSFSEIIESPVLTDSNLSHDDIVSFTKGNNKGLYRSIKQILSGDRVGTQFDKTATSLDHIANYDEVQILESLKFSGDDSMVVVLDNDSVTKTIDIPMFRRGRVNSGSQSLSFLPTQLAFSANDVDNEVGVDFGTPQSWSTTLNKTDFKDYKVLFRAHNWYVTGGVGSGLGGQMLVRAAQYGPVGENIKFAIDYPTLPSKTNSIVYTNTPTTTTVKYLFGSGTARTANIIPGTTFDVTDLGSDLFRWTFSPGVDFSTVLVGDVVSSLDDSGVSVSNRGQFRVEAVNAVARTIDVYNPNGSPTIVGQPEITTVTTVGDVVGSPAVNDVTTVADIAGSLDGTYFILRDNAGTVAFWYDVDDNGTAEPLHGASRSVKISTVVTGDSANDVASKTAAVIGVDPEFSATVALNVVTVTNLGNGLLLAGNAGTSGFTVTQTSPGVNDNSLDNKYFILQDDLGSVAFWYDVDNNGTPEPLHGADRSVAITTVVTGDSANTVASKTQVVVNADLKFNATVLGNVVTVTDVSNGNRPTPLAGTSGFTLSTTQNGSDGIPETILISTSFNIYPLLNTTVNDITTLVNDENDMLKLVAVGSTAAIIDRATRQENYVPAGPGDYSASLSYGHDPDPTSGLNEYVSLYDSESWILGFSNANPNFTLKKELLLTNVAPSVYAMDTCPNDDSVDLGEMFKLVPTTLTNVYHHLTQKALSQLPIVSNVGISSNIRSVQIKSNLLGSVGAVEIVGGRANSASFDVINESQKVSELGIDYLETKIKSFPDTLNKGDIIKLENATGVDRLNRLSAADSIDVVQVSGDTLEYRFNAKQTFLNQFVKFSIADVSATYGRPAGMVWRWTHNDSGSLFIITDKTSGVPGSLPNDEIAAGGSDAAALERVLLSNGSLTPQSFQLTVDSLPTQGDYFTFRSASGATFAVWFGIDGNVTAPTGASYVAATNKILVAILSTDTENQIVSKLATTLSADSNFTAEFESFQQQGADLTDVNEGDLLYAFGTLTGWSSGNKSGQTGDEAVAGFPIIAVNVASRYVDVVNNLGSAMASTQVGSGTVQITPSPIIKWNLSHAAPIEIVQISVTGGLATATTSGPHTLDVGNVFSLKESDVVPTVPGSGDGTVISVLSFNQFTFATSTPNGTYLGGNILETGKQNTRYQIESLGFNNMMRLKYVDGTAPQFLDNGVAVDDLLIIGGNTFKSNNAGSFRIRAVDNTSLIFENANAKAQLNTDNIAFNNNNVSVNWVSSSDQITSSAGSFENLAIGDSVKKEEDSDLLYCQVLGFNTGFPETATIVYLNTTYQGTTGSSIGIKYDQLNDVDKGVYLKNIEDITILEGDSARSSDTLFVSSVANPNWFNVNNTGTFVIQAVGTSSDYRPFLRVQNEVGVAETNRQMSIDPLGLKIIESEDNKFSSIRVIEHIAIDEFNDQRRVIYSTPADRAYKFSQSNKTVVSSVGKLGYNTDVTTGIDGYLYYTGLMRTVQRIVDGFEPDPETYPGRRAIGGVIELLPPLIRRVEISVDVTTNEGVNLGEITNEIKSVIINYIKGLGVGEDVILSQIIAKVMSVRGVAAITFNSPSPDTERIAIADIEKAFIEAKDISIA
jgi:uncharacterized phage protein gp47/JayE